jgi:hypothetical protein
MMSDELSLHATNLRDKRLTPPATVGLVKHHE